MTHAHSLRSLAQSLTRSFRRGRQPARPRRTRPFTPHVETLEDLTLPSTVIWDGPAGGNWNDCNRWRVEGANPPQFRCPTANDDAVINTPGITVTHSQGADAVRSLTSRAALVFSGGTLTLGSASVLHSTLNFFGGTIRGAGDLTIHGLFSWAGGMMAGAGQTHARGGMRFYAAFNNGLDGRTLNNYGLAEWAGRGTLEMSNGAALYNRAGAMFVVSNLATFRLGWNDTVVSTFHNQGTFRVNFAGDVTSFSQNANRLGVVLNNTGTVHLIAGQLSLGGGATNSGTVNVGAGTRLNLVGGNYQFNAGTQVTGDGWVRVLGATASFNADVQARNFELASGVVAGYGTLRVTGTLSWSGGQFYGAGRTEVAPGGQFDINGSGAKYLQQRWLVNGGTATWTGTGNVVLRPDANFENLAGAMINVRNDAAIVQEGAPAVFINRGVIRKLLSNGTTRIDTWFENRGVVDLQSGTLRVGHGTSTGSFVVGGTFRLLFAPQEGTAHVLQASSSISMPGPASSIVTFASGMVDVGGSYRAGNTEVVGASVVFRNEVPSGSLLLNGGSVNFMGNATFGSFYWMGGDVRAANQVNVTSGMTISGAQPKAFRDGTLVNYAGPSTWTGTGPVMFENGAIFVNRPGARFDVLAESTLSFSGGLSKLVNQGTVRRAGTAFTLNGSFLNEGTMAVESGRVDLIGWGYNSGRITAAAGTELRIDSLEAAPSGSLESAGSVWFNGIASYLAGTYNVTGSTYVIGGVMFDGAARTGTLRNAGGLVALSGSLTVTGNYVQEVVDAPGATYLYGGEVTVGGLMDIQAGVLVGTGTINGNVRNNGRVVVGDTGWAGLLVINGDYTQTADGLLDIEIGGIVAGADYDQIQITGRATLDGTLNIMLLEGFSANADDNFRVLTFGQRTGQFGTINGLDIGGGMGFLPMYEANSLDLWTIQV